MSVIKNVEQFFGSYFEFKKYKTNLQTEFVAGISTYLSLAYIFVVNPAILSKSGIDPSAALIATVIASALATFAMGIWANLPFAVAPGLEMNGFFTYVVCGTLGMTWQEGLGTVFVSGLLCILFTRLRVRKSIINSIPTGLKKAVATSVGVFVATIGLFLAHILAFKNGVIDFANFNLSAISTHLALILYIGFIISFILGWKKLRFPGGMLIAIVVGAILCRLWNIKIDGLVDFTKDPWQASFALDFSVILHPRYWSPILVFFVIDFVGGIGKFIALTENTTIQENGKVHNIDRGLYVDGAGTVLGSLLGTSSLIAFVESAVGIQAGGRTGLTALVCCLLMAGSIVFAPVVAWVPPEAASGVLLYVGYLLLPKRLDSSGNIALDKFDMSIAIIMGLISLATFSLDKAMAIGFWSYFLKPIILQSENRLEKQHYWLAVIASLLTATIIWQWMVSPSS